MSPSLLEFENTVTPNEEEDPITPFNSEDTSGSEFDFWCLNFGPVVKSRRSDDAEAGKLRQRTSPRSTSEEIEAISTKRESTNFLLKKDKLMKGCVGF